MNTKPALFETVSWSSFEPAGRARLAPQPRTARPGGFRAAASEPPGEPFLDAFMHLFWAVMNPSLLFLGVLEPDERWVRTLMTYSNGERAEDFRFLLSETPCSMVLGPQAMCIYTESVTSLFPRSARLRRLHAEGYVGMPLLSRDGKQIGMIAAVTAHPIGNLEEIRVMLYTFGSRLSLELERLLTTDQDVVSDLDRAIAEAEKTLVDGLPA